ncbi:MAG: hypothetical protein E7049_04670 [Lentisphaerae bacterium]|nr:hypothetical protein [Lentisphaerota bacterium]
MRRIAVFAIATLAAAVCFAGQTSTLLKRRAKSTDNVTLGKWQRNFTKARNYATSKGVPFVAVWSNGDSCAHCMRFASACNSTNFKNFQKTSGMVFWFGCSSDKEHYAGSSPCEWSRKGKTMTFPFVRIYWPKGKVDVATMGDTLDGRKSGATGGKKAASYIKNKVKAYKYYMPYKIAFYPNGGEGEMATISAKYGVSKALPANAFTREDFAFAGWAKTSTGSVAYKNKATVKNLTTTLNGTAKLYAKWTRTTYRGFTVGESKTLTISANKGWITSGSVPGMKWNATKATLSGKPTKAGTFKVVFKNGSSTRTRYFVVSANFAMLPHFVGFVV